MTRFALLIALPCMLLINQSASADLMSDLSTDSAAQEKQDNPDAVQPPAHADQNNPNQPSQTATAMVVSPGQQQVNPMQGYGQVNPMQGYGQVNPMQGYGQVNPMQGYGQVNPMQGYGQVNPMQGYGQRSF